MCKDVDHPGIRMMGDFWHMTWEETCDRGAILSAGPYLKHMHIASRRRRKTPGEDGEADNYLDGFKALKEVGYQGYVSFECGCGGDPKERIPAAVRMLQRQWEQA
jgi:sugar phosphate isomerase/epimerase